MIGPQGDVRRRRHGGMRNRGEVPYEHPASLGGRDEFRQFSPTPAQIRYRNGLLKALRNGDALSNVAICRNLGMSRQTLWEWQQDHDFRKWLRVSLDPDYEADFRLAIYHHVELALNGRTRSLSVLAKLKELGVF